MNENYINTVRNSLYDNSQQNTKYLTTNMPKKSSKIKFSIDNFNSENVFNLSREQLKKDKTKKIRKRENSLSDDFFLDRSKYEEKRNKKLRVQGTQRLEQDSSSQEIICPSTSEHSDLTKVQKQHFSHKKLCRKQTKDLEQDLEFDLNDFFSTREFSFNESFTESHSGIEYEFVTNKIRDVQITSTRIIDDSSNSENMSTKAVVGDEENSSERNDADVIINDCTDQNSELISSETEIEQAASNHQEPDELPVIEIPSNEELIINSEELISNTSEISYRTPSRNSFQSVNLGYQKVIILAKNYEINLFGLCTIKVLHGKLEILGCTLTKRSKEMNVFSPRGSSLLIAKNITENNEKLYTNENLKHVQIENTSVVFICSKLEDYKMAFLEKYISQQIFPKVDIFTMPQIIFDPKDKFNIISTNPQWDTVLKAIKPSTRLLIAGGKHVGKSTFLRYSINKLLNRFKKVRIIDLDPGQSEFSIPGCISVVTLSDPILGPNYTHLQRPDRSYLSNINIGQDPNKYLQLIQFLMNSLRTSEDLPTLINYMGFATGIGLKIISSAITHLKITDLVQIDSKIKKKNFVQDLTVKTVRKNCYLFGGNPRNVDYNLIKMAAMTDDNAGWSLEPRQVREMCVLAYFGDVMKSGAESLISHKVPMYEIGLNSIKITDTDGNVLPPAAVNANMVALCSATQNNEIFIILGYGIVRGIDLRAEKLVLITPEPIDILNNVFYLVLTSVSLPPSVYMTSDGITGPLPYVMKGELTGLGQITKRSFLPPNKK